MKKNSKQKNDDLRPIDFVAQDIYSWWSESFITMRTTKIKTWKALMIVAFFAGFLSALYWAASVSIYNMSLASNERATLSFFPNSVEVTEQENFDLNVMLDSEGSHIVVARAIVNYDTDYFELVSYDTSDSIFTVDNSCVYEGKTCEIIENDVENGRISITMAKPTPGVVTDSGVVAELVFKALQPDAGNSDRITYDYTLGSYDDSDVILDDGNGTDILSTVVNASITVNEIDTTPPVLSEITSVPSPTSDRTPNYTFNSTEAGTIVVGGSCSSNNDTATIGGNTITFNQLSPGTYSDCTIVVTDSSGNASAPLNVSSFVVEETTNETRADVNDDGDITIADVQLTFRKFRNLDMSQTSWVDHADTGDVNCDGNITIADVQLIFRRFRGLDMSSTPWCVVE